MFSSERLFTTVRIHRSQLGSDITQNPKPSPILLHRVEIMNNMVSGVTLDIYALLAAPCSFRLLFRRGFSLAHPSPESVFLIEQSALLFHGWPFPCCLNTSKPGLPRRARSDIRVAYFGRGSPASVVVPSQVGRLETGVVFGPGYSNADGGHSRDNNFSWHSSNTAGP